MPRLIKHLSFHTAYIFYFFTLSKSIDDDQSFVGYVLSTNFVFRIRFSSASRAHPSKKDYDKQKAVVVVKASFNTENERARERRKCISEA